MSHEQKQRVFDGISKWGPVVLMLALAIAAWAKGLGIADVTQSERLNSVEKTVSVHDSRIERLERSSVTREDLKDIKDTLNYLRDKMDKAEERELHRARGVK